MYTKNRKDNHLSEVQDNYKIAQLATKINWQPVYSDAYNLENGEYQRYRLNIWQYFVLFFFYQKSSLSRHLTSGRKLTNIKGEDYSRRR
ncbi:MAG: hypothetical protein ACTIN4_07350 [Leuconostoc mesenteroides]|uniref:hypothetical protein n=1 Tax=Leuconostoc falkenbergense TaxID=2766470 RepID=UPI003F9BD13E